MLIRCFYIPHDFGMGYCKMDMCILWSQCTKHLRATSCSCLGHVLPSKEPARPCEPGLKTRCQVSRVFIRGLVGGELSGGDRRTKTLAPNSLKAKENMQTCFGVNYRI